MTTPFSLTYLYVRHLHRPIRKEDKTWALRKEEHNAPEVTCQRNAHAKRKTIKRQIKKTNFSTSTLLFEQ